MLDWLIIGGGVHGTHISLYLTRVRGVDRDRLRVLDPHPEAFAHWEHFTRNTGMSFLRSPVVHQIDIPAHSLMHFSDTREGRSYKRFIEPFDRPATSLFGAHSRHVVRKNKLDELRIQGRARGLTAIEGGYRVETEQGAIEARRVLLAISAGDMPRWPAWGRELKDAGAPIDHIFDLGFDRTNVPRFQAAVVIGGGITGAQVALALSAQVWGGVTLLTPHNPRVKWFDANPGWMGPLRVEEFRKDPCMASRRAMIRAARHKGSMPCEVRGQLHQACKIGKLAMRVASVTSASFEDGLASLQLDDGTTLKSDRIVLATGFELRRPGGEWLDRAIAEMGLPLSPCGYPVVDPTLSWRPGLHVSGPLAELEVGPASRNIIGARFAAERLRAVS